MSRDTCRLLIQTGITLITVALALLLCVAAGYSWMWIYEAHLAGVLPAGLVAAGMGIYLATSLFIVPSHRSLPDGATGGAARGPHSRVAPGAGCPSSAAAGSRRTLPLRRRPRPWQQPRPPVHSNSEEDGNDLD